MPSPWFLMVIIQSSSLRNFFRDTSTRLYFVHRVFPLSGRNNQIEVSLKKDISFGLAY